MGKMGIILMFGATFLAANCSFINRLLPQSDIGVRSSPSDPDNKATVSFDVTSKNAGKNEIKAYQKMAKFCDGDSFVIEHTGFHGGYKWNESSGKYEDDAKTVYKAITFKCLRNQGVNLGRGRR